MSLFFILLFSVTAFVNLIHKRAGNASANPAVINEYRGEEFVVVAADNILGDFRHNVVAAF